MTNGEHQAVATANRYKGDISDEDKVKHLATEVIELGYALAHEDETNIREEIGDCLYLLLHILSRHNPEKFSMTTMVLLASDKMERKEFKKLRNDV